MGKITKLRCCLTSIRRIHLPHPLHSTLLLLAPPFLFWCPTDADVSTDAKNEIAIDLIYADFLRRRLKVLLLQGFTSSDTPLGRVRVRDNTLTSVQHLPCSTTTHDKDVKKLQDSITG